MKIISYNVNGIRSAMSKGFIDFLKQENPDTVCLQELKAQEQDIDQAAFEALGYNCYWFPAEKKGYSGVGILSKEKAKSVVKGMGHKLFDTEGRVIRAVFENCEVISAYFPSGTTGDIRQQVKYEFLEAFHQFIQNDPNKDKLLVCGDYNICHNDIDIHDPVGNKNSSEDSAGTKFDMIRKEIELRAKKLKNEVDDIAKELHSELDSYKKSFFRFNISILLIDSSIQ
jgi:exodeoxyribonuclease-3